MARVLNKLSTLTVDKVKKPGLYGDGGNLYLQVTEDLNKSWLFRFMLHGKAREMGLGPIHTVTLAKARAKAGECRSLLLEGIDPLEARKTEQTEAKLAAAKDRTFRACAKAYIEAHKAGWKQERHAKQWEQSLEKHAYKILGEAPIQSVDTNLVLRVLEPIWNEKTETAKRLRGRIESIIDWAKARGFRKGENPARWRGHLDNMLASPNRLIDVEHFAALPYTETHDFLKALDGQEGLGAHALKLAIFTAKRTDEVIGAAWNEFDFENKVWTIPAERMKGRAKKEHQVPLTAPAIAVLKKLKQERGKAAKTANVQPSPFVFPSTKKGKNTLSNAAMLSPLKRMNRQDITVHGFRSTFKDWSAEQTEHADEVSEAALAHAIPNKVKAAYLRSDFFQKRRNLMEDWAEYCLKPYKDKMEKKPINTKTKR